MRFSLVDRVERFEPGRRIVVVKNLTLAEEYLAEHFPIFPVMPGVLMVETATQAGSWLVRVTEDFRHSMILLNEVKNAKFGHFVVPGKRLLVDCEWHKDEGDLTTLKVSAEVDGKQSLSARLVLRRFNLADRWSERSIEDEEIRTHLRKVWRGLSIGGPAAAVNSST